MTFQSVATKVGVFILLLVICFAAWFAYALYTDAPPQFFPLDDADATYTITKRCPHQQGNTEQPNLIGTAYCVDYKGTHAFQLQDTANATFFSITVGNSQVDLEPLIGKQVKNIKGKFASSAKQCIRDSCIDIGGPFVVLDVHSLEVAN